MNPPQPLDGPTLGGPISPNVLKLPVSDVELEAAVLGMILAEPAYFKIANRYLKTAEVFYKALHQDIYRAMLALAEADQQPAMLEVRMMLRQERVSVEPAQLMEIMDAAYDVNFEHRCLTIYELHHRRRIYLASMVLAKDAFDLSVDILEAGQQFRSRLDEMESKLPDRRSRSLTDMGKAILDGLKDPEKATYIRSGIKAYDEVIGGYENGCFYILAARPSMGKSAFTCEHLNGIAIRQSIPTGILLLEGTGEALIKRMSSRYSGFTSDDIKQRRADPAKLERALDIVTQAPLQIDDSPCTLDRLESRIVRLVLEGAKIVFVDYLQRIKDHRPKALPMDTVTAISGKLKDLALQLMIPIVALSQLSRSCESRTGSGGFDRRPILSDLRSSGDLEQDADGVAFLFRPEYYGLTQYPDGFSTENMTEVHIAKNREGPVRTGDEAVMLFHRLPLSAYFSTKGEFDNFGYILTGPKPF